MNLKIKLTCRAALLLLGISIASIGHAQPFLTNGLIAYYPFNGNANDASGNGNDGIVYGATLTTNRFGYANSAYYFSGTNYITVPIGSSVVSNDFTASAWFNVQDLANGFLTILYEQNNSLNISVAGNTCGCDSPSFLTAYSSYAPNIFSWFLSLRQQTPIGTYCQVVITKAGTNVTMYLNSQVAMTGFVSPQITQSGTNLYIGRAVLNEDILGDTTFHGSIEDIRIYDRALSSNEVVRLNALESAPIVNVHEAVYLDSCNLWVGTNYQVQVSSNLVNWTNFGTVFTATNSYWRSTNYWDVANWNQLFFRVITSS